MSKTQVKLELMRRKAWNDFFYFAKYICQKTLMEDVPHRELCDFFADESVSRKLILLPRDTFKSTIGSECYPLWQFWKSPNHLVMLDSETYAKSKSFLRAIKEQIASNELLRRVCVNSNGEFLLEPNKDVPGGWCEDSMILKHRTRIGVKEPSVFCAGVDNAVTGYHPTIIVYDDIVSEHNVTTADQIKKVKDHFKMSQSLIVSAIHKSDDSPDPKQVVIGTRYHFDDLYDELEDKPDTGMDGIAKMIRPAILPNGKLYFPKRLTHEVLEAKRKDQGDYIYSCQYMLSPVSEEDAKFKRAWFRFYEFIDDPSKNFGIPYPDDATDVEKQQQMDFNIYVTVDVAISKKERADFTVISAIAERRDKHLFVLHRIRGKFDPHELIDEIFNMYKWLKSRRMHTKMKFGIETVAFQKALAYFIREEMKRRGITFKLDELKADTDKERRIKSLIPIVQRGELWFRTEGDEDAIKEFTEFPFGKHDDIPDAMAYILQLMRPTGLRRFRRDTERRYERNSITGYGVRRR